MSGDGLAELRELVRGAIANVGVGEDFEEIATEVMEAIKPYVEARERAAVEPWRAVHVALISLRAENTEQNLVRYNRAIEALG